MVSGNTPTRFKENFDTPGTTGQSNPSDDRSQVMLTPTILESSANANQSSGSEEKGATQEVRKIRDKWFCLAFLVSIFAYFAFGGYALYMFRTDMADETDITNSKRSSSSSLGTDIKDAKDVLNK